MMLFYNSLFIQPAKMYKLKHLSKVEVITNDPSGCTFTLVRLLNDFIEVVYVRFQEEISVVCSVGNGTQKQNA